MLLVKFAQNKISLNNSILALYTPIIYLYKYTPVISKYKYALCCTLHRGKNEKCGQFEH